MIVIPMLMINNLTRMRIYQNIRSTQKCHPNMTIIPIMDLVLRITKESTRIATATHMSYPNIVRRTIMGKIYIPID